MENVFCSALWSRSHASVCGFFYIFYVKVDALRVACGLKLDHGVFAIGFSTAGALINVRQEARS